MDFIHTSSSRVGEIFASVGATAFLRLRLSPDGDASALGIRLVILQCFHQVGLFQTNERSVTLRYHPVCPPWRPSCQRLHPGVPSRCGTLRHLRLHGALHFQPQIELLVTCTAGALRRPSKPFKCLVAGLFGLYSWLAQRWFGINNFARSAWPRPGQRPQGQSASWSPRRLAP